MIRKILQACLIGSISLLLMSGCSTNDDNIGDDDNIENGGSGDNEDGSDDQGEPGTDSGDNTGGNSDDTGNTEGEDDNNDSMTLVFQDDFEGTDSIPDQSKWILCTKGDDSWNRYLSGSYAQVYQKEGSLYIYGERDGDSYLTGGIETRGKFEFQHGKVECRAKFLRQPKGNHTGIWMMPVPPAQQWPKSGEIDIMEHLGDQDIIYETVHSWYIDDMGHKTDPIAQKEVEVDNEEWNIYGVIWTADSIIYTVNGVKHLSYPNMNLTGETGTYQWPFNHPFYLILSQSLGGEGTWAGPIDNSALPAIFQIDWIKVYAKNDDVE